MNYTRTTFVALSLGVLSTLTYADFPWDDARYVKQKFESLVVSLVPAPMRHEVTFRWQGAMISGSREMCYEMRFTISHRALNELKYNVTYLIEHGALKVDGRRKIERAAFNNVPGVMFYAKATAEEIENFRRANGG